MKIALSKVLLKDGCAVTQPRNGGRPWQTFMVEDGYRLTHDTDKRLVIIELAEPNPADESSYTHKGKVRRASVQTAIENVREMYEMDVTVEDINAKKAEAVEAARIAKVLAEADALRGKAADDEGPSKAALILPKRGPGRPPNVKATEPDPSV